MNKLFSVVLALFLAVSISAQENQMFLEASSKYSFEETIEQFKAEAEKSGWKVPTIHHLHESVSGAGYDVLPAAVLEVCKPSLAGQLLDTDDTRFVTSMMPCRVSVYEKSNGDVIISRMNTGMFTAQMGGEIKTVMTEADNQVKEILEKLYK